MKKRINTKISAFAAVCGLLLVSSFALTPLVHASSPTTATFSGTAKIHLVVKILSSGDIVNVAIPSTFTVKATPGGHGVGTLALALTFTMNGMTIHLSADNGAGDPVGTGQVIITSSQATGGGTLSNTVSGYMSQFGFAVSASGGQFQCQNTGRSAGVMDGPMSMLLGTPVDVHQMDVHGTIPAGGLAIA